MARNLTERLGGEYDLESRGSAFSCTSKQEPTKLSHAKEYQMLCYAGFKVSGIFA